MPAARKTRMSPPVRWALLAVVFGVAACGPGGTAVSERGAAPPPEATRGAEGGTTGHEGHGRGGDQPPAWGVPEEDPGDTARVVEIRAAAPLRFEPAAVEVEVGETVTFRVTNTDSIAHEFVLGTEEEQRRHAEQMAEPGHDHHGPAVLQLDPGKTATTTWTFTSPGKVLYGCHVPGHYDAGMMGTITVAPSPTS